MSTTQYLNQNNIKMTTKEQIILEFSNRKMNILFEGIERKEYLEIIAEKIKAFKKGVVFIFTGFYVNGHAETDGPVGAYFIALALKKYGFSPIIISDQFCNGFFEYKNKVDSLILPMDLNRVQVKAIIEKHNPVAMISAFTAPLDFFFEEGKCLKICIGDGGNEIGMGNFYDQIKKEIPEIEPCVITCDFMILSTTSNWGAYGLIAALSEAAEIDLMPTPAHIKEYFDFIVSLGAVDGISGKNEPLVDGFDLSVDSIILNKLRKEKD
jgi:3-isopropylmalate dehydratase small subunit